MALFQPCKVSSSQLNSLAKVEGQFIVCTDTQEIYFDESSSSRILIGTAAGAATSIPVDPEDTSDLNIWIKTS